MTRLPGCALQVRVRVAGFFDRASCPGEKLAGIHAGHPAGFPPPARRVIRGPRGSRATSRATHRLALPRGYFFVGAHPVREQPTERNTAALRSRTSALLQGGGRPVDGESMSPVGSLWERTLCATNLRSGTSQRGCRAQGALPQTSPAPGAARVRHAWAKADAQRGPALSPQRHGALRSAWKYPLCSGGGCQATTCLARSGLSQGNAASS
jgi:hypothetical protein